jgi:hypothetical protein
MSRPTLRELALEADAFRALARAWAHFAVSQSDRNRRALAEAEDQVHRLGLHAFSPSAVDRLAEPERLGSILTREGFTVAPAPSGEGFVWDDDSEDEGPSAIAIVIGDCLTVGAKR